MIKFARSLAIFGTGSLFSTVTQVVKGKLGAIFLGVEGIGVLSQLTNAWSLLYIISGLGFYTGIVQKISKAHGEDDANKLKQQFSSSLIFLSIFSIFTTAVAVSLSYWISDLIFKDGGQRYWLVALILSSVPAAVVSQIYIGVFSGCQMVRHVVGAQVVTDLVGAVIFSIMIMYEYLTGAVAAFCLLNIVKLTIQFYLINKDTKLNYLHSRPIAFNFDEIRDNFGYGVSGLFLVAISTLTTMIVSRWVIEYEGENANGLFAVSWKVCSLYFGALSASASGFYFPVLAATKNSEELSNRVFEAVTLYMYIMTPLAVGIIIGGETLMRILFSGDFATAASLLLWFLPGDILRIFSETIGLSFLAKRRLIVYSCSYIGWASLFLILSFCFIKHFGLIGVGYAYFLSHLINSILMLIYVKFSFHFTVSYEAARSTILALAAAVIAASVVLLGFSLWLQIAFGVLVLLTWFALSWRMVSFQEISLGGLNKIKKIIQ